MAEVAAVGWAISILGWLASPITTRLFNHGFSLLAFHKSDKLRDLESRILPRLALLLEYAQRIPPEQEQIRADMEQWACRLRSAFYDLEDMLDVADYNRLENKGISPSGVMTTLDHAKNIISGKTSKLKKILTSLEKITEEGSQFLLLLERTIGSGTNGNGISNPANTSIRSTTSSPTQIIIGRDKERDEIVRMLRDTMGEPKSWIIWAMGLKDYGLRLVFTMLSLIWAKIGWAITGLGPRLDPARNEATGDCEQSCWNSKCYSVISIYGIAGSGKTTLAQHVCSYEKMDSYFFPVMWIYVSPGFSVDKIYQKMLEAATGKPSSEFSNLDTLQMKLEAELTGKRFLLVLDDIWHEKDASAQDKLNQLLSPLKVGKKGSKVLVTTRFKDVAMSLGSQRIIPVPREGPS